jgi:hypothetical protein
MAFNKVSRINSLLQEVSSRGKKGAADCRAFLPL